ncbi:MAG: DNA methyltransferase [Candidatus Bilamarchaeaceae archaeon]
MKITEDLSIGKYFTFEPSKDRPIYNWFYYKEAYSPEVLDYFLQRELAGKKPELMLDPFCGSGTTLLWAKQHGVRSIGVDASPLAVFASRVKTRGYSPEELDDALAFIKGAEEKGAEWGWDFELFRPATVFPPRNLNFIRRTRERIEELEDEKVAGLLLLALISIIPMCGLFIKDGGVLRQDKKKSVGSAKDLFKRKVKRMVAEIAENGKNHGEAEPEARLGDARMLDGVADGSVDAIMTSPPYLNNIDYTKVYGLELSLLGMIPEITRQTRAKSMRSFITSKSESEGVPEEAKDVSERIPIAGTYFADSELVLKEMLRVLRDGGKAGYVVGNSVIHGEHIPVDEMLCAMAERLGFADTEIISGLERWADVKPAKVRTRESLIVFQK